MNRTALRSALTSPITVGFTAFTALAAAYLTASGVDTLSTVTWACLFGAVALFGGTTEYRIARDRLEAEAERAQWNADRLARWEAHRAEIEEAREQHEKERDILRADHERRMAAIRATGADPGPSPEVVEIRSRVA